MVNKRSVGNNQIRGKYSQQNLRQFQCQLTLLINLAYMTCMCTYVSLYHIYKRIWQSIYFMHYLRHLILIPWRFSASRATKL